MSDQAERPTSLRRMPRPAPDERVDPVDYRAPAPAPAPSQTAAPATSSTTNARSAAAVESSPTPRRGRPRRELTAQFSTRLTPEVIALIDQAADREGTTIRDVVEQAIRRTWG